MSLSVNSYPFLHNTLHKAADTHFLWVKTLHYRFTLLWKQLQTFQTESANSRRELQQS